MRANLLNMLSGVVAAILLPISFVWAAEPIKIAIIDPLSGPFANVGTTTLHAFQFEFDRINRTGGVLGRSFELIAFDSKSSPQEAVLQVRAAIDQGVRFIVQGSGSNVGYAVSDAVAKHNARNPGAPIIYLNHGALDPGLTEEKCHFWHFRFAAHGNMIMNGVIDALAGRAHVKRVYLINQDYAWGHSVSKEARTMLAARRPDITIVGDDLHPIAKVKDFAAYVAKMKLARADAIVSGNWGNDLALLVRAIKQAGLSVEIYAPIAGLTGTPAMMSEAGADRVRSVLFWHPNLENSPLVSHAQAFRARYKSDWNWLPVYLVPELLTLAINTAKSADPQDVALALEGLRHAGPTGEIWMRSDDHQLMMPLFQALFTRAGQPGVEYDAEGTGFGWKTEERLDASDNVPPIRCRVKRPS